MKRVFSIFSALLIVLSLGACSKVEGPGGSSSITGKIHAEVRDGAGNLLYEYDVPKEDVFLIYGSENTVFDDDVETSYEGSFRFDYLETGNYQLFVYSDCNTCESGKEALLQDVTIAEKKTVVDLGTIIIQK